MNTAEIKSNLHLLIDQITDSSKLQAIYTLLNNSDVYEWQKDIVRERVKNTNPKDYTSWDEIEAQVKVG